MNFNDYIISRFNRNGTFFQVNSVAAHILAIGALNYQCRISVGVLLGHNFGNLKYGLMINGYIGTDLIIGQYVWKGSPLILLISIINSSFESF